MPRILLVEDDTRTAELVAAFLRQEAFEVDVIGDGSVAIAHIQAESPDLVVLDWMLPGADGLTVCRQVRDRFDGPILMLTARTDEVDQIVGLEVGVDDYMMKPVRPRLLLARIRALLRRARPAAADEGEPDRIVNGWLVVDRSKREVRVSDLVVDLTTAEFDLLWLLARRAGSPVDRDALFTELRGITYDGFDRSMDMRVSQLRKRLSDADPEGRDPIRTVRGVGYQLVKV